MKKFSQITEAHSPDQDTEQLVRDVSLSLDMCKYIDRINVRRSGGVKAIDNGTIIHLPNQAPKSVVKKIFVIHIWFTKECIHKRKVGNRELGDSGFVFPLEEINSYWQEILDVMNTLDSYGFKCALSYYATNGAEMVISIEER
jgi:hypothetical protein